MRPLFFNEWLGYEANCESDIPKVGCLLWRPPVEEMLYGDLSLETLSF